MRRQLWAELENLSSLITMNWFVLGDFNSCLGAHEKTGRAPNTRACQDFITALDNCSLTCLEIKGLIYIWTNNRRGPHHVDIRLDHALCSNVSFQNWSSIECHTLARHCSDHNPLLLSCH